MKSDKNNKKNKKSQLQGKIRGIQIDYWSNE